MLTSRKVDVAKYINPKGLIHQPEVLNPDESWKLLQLKALPKRGEYLDIARDYERMEKLGREMLRNCAGLPLAIVILGGILVTKPSLIEWEKVFNDSLSSLKRGKGLGEDQQEQIFDILVRSYNDLPPQLKACFLYLGKFNEDEWIDAETLYQLWIAEGMVLSRDKSEGETMMQVAESYMGELVHKSMVQVRFNDSESSLTKFKNCCLHDLMRDLSISQGKAQEFFEAIDLQEGNKLHLSTVPNTRRLVVKCDPTYTTIKANSNIVKEPNHQRYRSMLLRVHQYWVHRSLAPLLGSHFANFRLLKVLALDNVRQTVSGNGFGTSIGRVIGSLIYLRYLSARNSDLIIFPWIQKLVLLQTLKLNGYGGDARYPPKSIKTLGKLAHLRHLYLPYWGIYKSEGNVKLRLNGLRKLETLENFNPELCEVKDLPELASLHRLGLTVKYSNDNSEEMMKYLATLALSSTSSLHRLRLILEGSYGNYLEEMIKSLATLTLSSTSSLRYLAFEGRYQRFIWKYNLDELTIRGKLPVELGELIEQQQQLNTNTHHIHASSIRITTLKLLGSELEEDPMPVLEKIPTLRDLDLVISAYEGKEMVCSAMGFPKLTRLYLYLLPNLEKWRVEEGSMPILSQLTISECIRLKEFPEGLASLDSLQKLMLNEMPSEFCDRARMLTHVPHIQIW